MIINKISFDNINYKQVNVDLDLTQRILKLSLNYDEFKEVFGVYFEEITDNPSKLSFYKKCYLINERGIYYTCEGCSWGFSRKNSNSPIIIYTAPINVIYENKIVLNDNADKIKIKKLTFKTSYPLYAEFKFHIKRLNFKYDSYKSVNVSITKTDDKFYIDLNVESKKLVSFKTLSDILYSILELYFLMLGDIPNLESIILFDDTAKFNLYWELVDKYQQRKNINSKNEIIGNVDENIINSFLIKKFINFRKDSKILFDMLMINMNSNSYLEIRNSSLLQLLEGLYKTIAPIRKDEFRTILNFYFKKNRSTKYILSKRDKRMINYGNGTEYIFIAKAVGHRNYLSHLDVNTKRNVFFEIENNYVYWKLSLCVRLYIIDYLGIKVDKKIVKKLLASVDKWATTQHLRYKI